MQKGKKTGLIGGRYVLDAVVGSGCFAEVSRVEDVSARKEGGQQQQRKFVALKVVKKDYYDDAVIELQLLKKIGGNDPSGEQKVTRLLDYFQSEGCPCFIFRLCGRSVASRLQMSKKPAHDSVLAKFISQMGGALRFLHFDCKIIHTDLKPENILEDADGQGWTICDFGSSSFYSTKADQDLICTLPYRPVEAILGLPWSYAVDMWSLGCIVYEIATGGQRLFRDLDKKEKHLRQIELIMGPVPDWLSRKAAGAAPVRKQRSVVDALGNPDLACLIRGCMKYDPAYRMRADEVVHHPFVVKYFPKPRSLLKALPTSAYTSGTVRSPGTAALREMIADREGAAKRSGTPATPATPQSYGDANSNSSTSGYNSAASRASNPAEQRRTPGAEQPRFSTAPVDPRVGQRPKEQPRSAPHDTRDAARHDGRAQERPQDPRAAERHVDPRQDPRHRDPRQVPQGRDPRYDQRPEARQDQRRDPRYEQTRQDARPDPRQQQRQQDPRQQDPRGYERTPSQTRQDPRQQDPRGHERSASHPHAGHDPRQQPRQQDPRQQQRQQDPRGYERTPSQTRQDPRHYERTNSHSRQAQDPRQEAQRRDPRYDQRPEARQDPRYQESASQDPRRDPRYEHARQEQQRQYDQQVYERSHSQIRQDARPDPRQQQRQQDPRQQDPRGHERSASHPHAGHDPRQQDPRGYERTPSQTRQDPRQQDPRGHERSASHPHAGHDPRQQPDPRQQQRQQDPRAYERTPSQTRQDPRQHEGRAPEPRFQRMPEERSYSNDSTRGARPTASSQSPPAYDEPRPAEGRRGSNPSLDARLESSFNARLKQRMAARDVPVYTP